MVMSFNMELLSSGKNIRHLPKIRHFSPTNTSEGRNFRPLENKNEFEDHIKEN